MQLSTYHTQVDDHQLSRASLFEILLQSTLNMQRTEEERRANKERAKTNKRGDQNEKKTKGQEPKFFISSLYPSK